MFSDTYVCGKTFFLNKEFTRHTIQGGGFLVQGGRREGWEESIR